MARVELSSRRGTLAEQVGAAYRAGCRRRGRAALAPAAPRTLAVAAAPTGAGAGRPRAASLEFFNGLGGFDAAAREYVIVLRAGRWTPAPWINVIANAEFGCLVSEAGAGCTWSVNSQENLLTAWSNDPVRDPPSEMFYVRDDESR